MKRHKSFLTLAFTLAAIALVALPLPARAVEDDVLNDVWFVTRLLGTEAGHAHSVTKRVTEDGKPMIHVSVDTEIALKRLGQSIEVRSSAESLESEGGEFVWSRSSTMMSGTETVTEATVKGDKLHVVRTVYGRKSEPQIIDWTTGVLGPHGAHSVVAPLLKTPGATYEYKTFLPDLGARAIQVKGKVIGPAEKIVLGKKRQLVEVHEQNDALAGMVSKYWYGEDAMPVLQLSPIAGGVETILVSKERALSGPTEAEAGALADGGKKEQPDALIGLSAQSNVRLPFPYSTDSVIYRFKLREGEIDDFVTGLQSERQTILRKTDDEVVVHVRSVLPGPEDSYPIPLEKTDAVREYLEANSWLQSDDDAFVKAVRDVIGDETDAWKAAKKLESWVYKSVDKNMGVAFASAREVLDDPQGDCTEHAVLLAGGLRAAGIPSRVSMGFLYFNGVYAGHAWCEAWIGRWIPLDGTMARPFVSAAHIDFGRSSLTHESLEGLFLNLSRTIGNVDMDILEYSQGGKTVRVDDTFKPYDIDGATYSNAIYGIRLEHPAGWEYDDLEDVGYGRQLLSMKESGGEGKIEVLTMALPYNVDFNNMLDRLTQGRDVDARRSIELDGRPAQLLVFRGDDGEEARIVAVTIDELMFVFNAETTTDSQRDAFASVVASIDWM